MLVMLLSFGGLGEEEQSYFSGNAFYDCQTIQSPILE
jgi:hypothetical protein